MNQQPANQLTINCDGGARGNPGPAASAFVVTDENGGPIYQQGFYLGVATNNQAEYHSVILALQWLSANNTLEEINIFLDSVLVVSQINGLFKIKNPNLRNLLFKIRELESEIKSKIIYSQIPREQNSEADLLVNQTLDTTP